MSGALAGQTAIVTGASSGIGREAARALAAAGGRVAVNHRAASSRDEALALVSEIEAAGGEAAAIMADVSREDEVAALFAETRDRFGDLHILVSNAGIERPSAVQNMSLDDWRAVIDVNLTGGFLCAREAARTFLRQGLRPDISKAAGKIVFVSSVHQVIPWAFQANYAASKGGVALLMQSLAQELAPARIRINSVAPGAIRTAINREAWDTPDAEAALLKLIPYGRVGDPRDVAEAIVWLSSDASDYVTGTTLFVDGGMTLYPEFRGNG